MGNCRLSSPSHAFMFATASLANVTTKKSNYICVPLTKEAKASGVTVAVVSIFVLQALTLKKQCITLICHPCSSPPHPTYFVFKGLLTKE